MCHVLLGVGSVLVTRTDVVQITKAARRLSAGLYVLPLSFFLFLTPRSNGSDGRETPFP